MDIRRGHYYTKDRKKTLDLSDRLAQQVGALERFLKHLQADEPEIYDDYLVALRHKLLALTSRSEIDLESVAIPKFQKVEKYNELEKLYVAYIFQLLEIPENYPSDTIELPWYVYDKSSLYPSYYRAWVLCEVMGRDKAIAYLKDYTDKVMRELCKPTPEFDDLDGDWEKEFPFDDYDPTDDIRFRLHKGKVGARVDRCISHDVMKPLNDPELCYVVCCYGEIAHTHAVRPHVVYTRTTSLILGGPYCDNCLHDKRYVSEIEHPGNEFWESLGSKLGE